MGSSRESYAGLSFWHATARDELVPRAALDGDIETDVAIIGGGLTGLWAAYYLQQRDPALRITVLEKEIAGFGASGRNGGWCSALFPRSTASLARAHGRDAAIAMRRAMIDTVTEVGDVVERERIDCDFRHGGTIVYARSAPQLAAAEADVAETARWGVDTLELLPAGRVGAARALGASFTPDCARLHPARLVRQLATLVETRGAVVHEHTEVLRWRPGIVETTRGTVRARHVIVATEGYTATLPQSRRRLLPLYSLMIATSPLPEAVWQELGIEHGHTFSDYRNLVIYGQRTADNRFAFGGRGARYHWGSAIRPEYDQVPRVFRHLRSTLSDLFPAAGELEVEYAWGGALGVPRDWHASVEYDTVTGIGSAGGYVGDGLSTTNLAGRTLADLITGTASELTRLPWVGHRSPNWEWEPLRFLGANAGLTAMTIADAEESITHRRSIVSRLFAPLVGH